MATGCSFATAPSTIREITDGTSQTIAVGERAELLGEATWVGSVTGAYLAQDPNDNDGVGVFEQEEGSTMVLGQSGEHKSPGDPTGEPDMFYSMHPAGVNFLFADGHVAFLTQRDGPQGVRGPLDAGRRRSDRRHLLIWRSGSCDFERAIFCLVLVAGCSPSAPKNDWMPIADVPRELQDVAKKELPNVTFDTARKIYVDGEERLEIRGKQPNGKVREVEVTPAGEIREVE